MIDKKIIYNNIGASLHYGMVFKRGMWIFTYSLLAVCLAIGFGGVSLLITSIGTEMLYSDIYGYLCQIIFGLLIAAGVVFVIIKKQRLKKKIYLWLDDAIERYAKTFTIDKTCDLIRSAVKLKVKISYKKEEYILYSGRSSKISPILAKGYYKVLSKYADKTIKVLYSPKYNEVLFLKNVY